MHIYSSIVYIIAKYGVLFNVPSPGIKFHMYEIMNITIKKNPMSFL